MLDFCEVSKIFKSELFKKPFVALDNVSFNIPQGDIVGFLGANGAGKTTSLKIAMDFIRPSSGKINFGKELGGDKRNAFRHIGYLPERPFFYPHLTGREFCFYMGKLSEQNLSSIKKEILKWSPRLKIDFALDREIKTYSKGMLQRIGLLATLLHNPTLIILDEPLSGVDPIGRKDLKDIFQEIHREGKTIFFSSHIVSDMEEICHSVICLKDGTTAYKGSLAKLISEHTNSDYKIIYTKNGEQKTQRLTIDKKDDFLKTLIDSQASILSVNQEKPTLEEIFYYAK